MTVLATSREGLAVAGEQLVGIPGLDGSGGDAAAVALFVDRARNVDSAFQLGADDVAIVAEICRRLDGLPLAIELAAARVNVVSAGELLVRGRLPRRLTVLMIRELAEIDRWLAAELPPEQRRELASIGAEKTPRELQALVHEVAARHLELTG